ncbi:dihydrofolate reductase family protein [Amycolatopsis sp. OK19-0408]|uniref:Riboflavin biosynthesis protein RibD n=1 Tax=Amycolatopsis iheyensis TaxID=2945988 RepID=A0A9X2NHC9_9PSEU|nr:dihydrofolate reductase family protein [Amycolatopsis iheyensis]MCR6488791.1 dihydrofolate reductase family protein [Amycolatopsis iheyensis]
MITRPHVLLSAAQSLDGFLDDTSPERLVLSTEDDFAVVDRLRAEADAIFVGAGTVRADNPRLLVRSPELRRRRLERGKPEQPVKVTVTTRGLDPGAQFFTVGDTEKIVYAPPGAADALADVATLVDAGNPPDFGRVLDDLGARGIENLLVEGGGGIHTRFLTEGLADELRLAIAPFFVGQPEAPRFVGPGLYPRALRLAGVEELQGMAILRYRAADEPTGRDVRRLKEAIALAAECPPSHTFRVGAVVTGADGEVIATGHSGEGDPTNHAEEAALAKCAGDPRLAEATMYSSLEPCSHRSSHPRSCTRLILDAGIPRVVFAWREPPVFVDARGTELLREAGRHVVEVPALTPEVQRENTHLTF